MANRAMMKLGRRYVKFDGRTLMLARYTKALPAPPVAVDWTRGITAWGMMLNDTLGDCTIAGCGHAVQVWTANTGPVATIPDPDILAAYETIDGYDPTDPSTDQGGVELDVLNAWRKAPIGGHGLAAFADPPASNLEEVRQAINLFGGVYIGLSLPVEAQAQDVWDAVPGMSPGSWGGHCVYVPKYDADSFTCITWGGLQKMTLAFWLKCCDEAHALLSNDWLSAKGSPVGLNLAQLQTDLQQVTS
jgi:hypothetical protein